MRQVVVGRWGKNLAVRVPIDVARISGLVDGEAVEIEAQDGAIVIRRRAAQDAVRRQARDAAAAIRAARKGKSLGGLTIQELRDEGRR